jgi:phospholipase/carboxylesterase
MNRLQSGNVLSFPKSNFSVSQGSLQKGPVVTAASSNVGSRRRERSEDADYSLFVPLHYERGYAYPLLVWLHGDGGNERELRQLMPHVSVRNYVAAAARGKSPAGGLKRAYTWEQDAASADDAAERVRACIDGATARFNIHPGRVFIAGNGVGGTMALRLALQFPEWFAGAVSLGGPMPRGNSPLGRLKAARDLPLLLASCHGSAEYPPERVAGDLRLLHAAGFSLALRQYPGEHELTTVMLADMDRWIMRLVCPATASAAL